MNYELMDVNLPVERRAFRRVLFCRLTQSHVERAVVEGDVRHVDFLFLEVNVVGHNPELADVAVKRKRLDEVGRVDVTVGKLDGFHADVHRQQAREVEVNKCLLDVDEVGRRLRDAHLAEADVEREGDMHAAYRHVEPRLLLYIGSKPVDCPPLHRRQIQAGGKQHDKQHQRQERPQDVFQRAFHAANLRFYCHTTKHSFFFSKRRRRKTRHVAHPDTLRPVSVSEQSCVRKWTLSFLTHVHSQSVTSLARLLHIMNKVTRHVSNIFNCKR